MLSEVSSSLAIYVSQIHVKRGMLPILYPYLRGTADCESIPCRHSLPILITTSESILGKIAASESILERIAISESILERIAMSESKILPSLISHIFLRWSDPRSISCRQARI
jgi:hypothetical protein